MLPWVVSFCAPNGAGKTTQAVLLASALEQAGHPARCIDTFEHIIKPEIFPEDLPDREYVYTVSGLEGEQRTTRETERAINKSGGMNTSSWVTWLVCGAMRPTIHDGTWALFSGFPRSVSQAKEFVEEFGRLYAAGLAGGLYVIRIEVPLEIARQRLVAAFELLSSEEQERIRYKIDEMPKRFAWFKDDTLPAFAVLERSRIPQARLVLIDDARRTPEQVHTRIFKQVTAVTKLRVGDHPAQS